MKTQKNDSAKRLFYINMCMMLATLLYTTFSGPLLMSQFMVAYIIVNIIAISALE